MKKLILFFFALLLIASCSIQKRKYQKGFYVNWHKTTVQPEKNSVAKQVKKPNAPSINANTKEDDALLAFAGNATSQAPLKHLIISKKANPDSCDEITFKNGQEVKAKILEITSSDIKYKKCAMPDGPLYVVKKSEVFMVKYSNGTREVFKTEPAPYSQNASATNQRVNTGNQRTHPLAVLSLIFGIAGIYPLFVIGSILALIFGTIALRQIREMPNVYKGEGLARTGKIMGFVALCVAVAIILIILIGVLYF